MKSQFWYCNEEFRKIWNKYNVYLSEKFCNYFSDKVKDILFREAGLKPSFKVGLSAFCQDSGLPMYEPGTVSKLNIAISILPEFIDNISFCWRSKTGKLIHTYDDDFDENDLECWIEGLNPILYWEELNKVSKSHPLEMKNLPYELKVYGIGTHMGLIIELENKNNALALIRQMSDEVERHNQRSESNGRAEGVVHNCYGDVMENEIYFRIDVGSAGVIFIKKLLRLLAKYPEVKMVTVDL